MKNSCRKTGKKASGPPGSGGGVEQLPAPRTRFLSESTENITQDFTDIFAVILGFAELAAANEHIRGDTKLARYIDEIRKSGRRGSELLRDWVNDDRSRENDSASR